MAERHADGMATWEELDSAYAAAFDVAATLAETKDALKTAQCAAWTASFASHPQYLGEAVASEAAEAESPKNQVLAQANLLRCIFGNPFRPVAVDPTWLMPSAVKIAQAIYDERAFDRLPFLADALMAAACTNEDILAHCRSAGEHVRGCWVVDMLLGKA